MPLRIGENMIEQNTEAVCGNCGNKFSQHFIETGHGEEQIAFCNTETNGDIFTEEPSDMAVMSFIRNHYQNFHEAIVSKWKRENGHS